MKRNVMLILLSLLLLFALAGCRNNDPESNGALNITVISREDGSGTRGAFIELFGIEEKDSQGNKTDLTIDTAEISSSTSVVMTSVAGDPAAIGYSSLGSLNDMVKALSIDGVAPSIEAVKDGSYPISRPFNLAVKNLANPTAEDFIAFILSSEGQDVVERKGYIRIEDTGPYDGNRPYGKVVVAGSSSVSPLMEALTEAYRAVNSGAEIEIQQSDSTTGMNAVAEGICDIGMASRELKDSETEQGLSEMTIALDGIAVIVNPKNPVLSLSTEQVKQIYTGLITNWSEVE